MGLRVSEQKKPDKTKCLFLSVEKRKFTSKTWTIYKWRLGRFNAFNYLVHCFAESSLTVLKRFLMMISSSVIANFIHLGFPLIQPKQGVHNKWLLSNHIIFCECSRLMFFIFAIVWRTLMQLCKCNEMPLHAKCYSVTECNQSWDRKIKEDQIHMNSSDDSRRNSCSISW